MSPATFLVAMAGTLVVAGILAVIVGLRPAPVPQPSTRPRRLGRAGRSARIQRRTKILLGVGLSAGVVVAAVTGWLVAIVILPAAIAGLPVLLSPPPTAARIDKLEALEEWTRALAGVLTVGVGLEQAMIATLKSTPDPIRPEVTTLVRRLRARMGTEQALRTFADDLNDTTGDLVAANLILGSRRRGQGLAAVLQALAESVAEDVKARRVIEADRAKPRSTARWVTIITVTVLGVLALTGDYIAPYGTLLGQTILISLLGVYVALLLWLRNMAKGKPLARFLGRGQAEARA